MTLDQLRAVRAVAACGSFSRAAHDLFVTQPALSMQVKALEQELGQRLFDRDRRSVRLTQAGQAVLRRAQPMLAEAQAIPQDLADLQGLVAGRLTIACSDTVGRYLLLPPLARFVKRYPGVQVTVRNTTSQEACRFVAEGEADIGLATAQGRQAGLAFAAWRAYRDVALCGPAHGLAKRSEVSLRDLAQERLLLLERGTASREALEVDFRRLGLRPASVMEAGSVETQKDFAAIGLGVAIAPDFAAGARAAGLRKLAIREAPARSIEVVTRQGRAQPAAAQAFLDALGRPGPTSSA